MSHHQEIEHADLEPQTRTYPCPVDCGVKPFITLEYLHSHVKCNHLEILSSPTQLPPSNVSDRDAQPDRRAQLDDFLAEAYLPGMENNLNAIADQRASREVDSFTVDDLHLQKSSRRAHNPRVHHEPRMRRPNSLMQRQLPARTADDHAVEIQRHFRNTRSDRGLHITATNSNASFQRQALRGQHTMEGINNFDVQHERSPSRPQYINSPTPSLSGQFTSRMQISDQSHVFQGSSDFGEELAHSGIQQDHQGMSVAMRTAPLRTSTAFQRSWDPQNQATNPLNQQNLDSYDNIGFTQTDASFQPNYDYSNMPVPTAQTGGFSNGYVPPGFQTDTQNTTYLMNDGTWLEGPVITLNNGSVIDADQDDDLTFALNTLHSDQILSQQNNPPNLDYSNLSSSGASESLLSPVDAPNLFNDNKHGDEWESASLMYGINNMGIGSSPPGLAVVDASER